MTCKESAEVNRASVNGLTENSSKQTLGRDSGLKLIMLAQQNVLSNEVVPLDSGKVVK